ncbi:MAG: thermonuclease family protein [Hyphomicrobium sp.]|jgi:endonuclease YncB( thermonuclease family)|nr:thermonuclease family protein [Hyphomicrobium sp.]
MSVLRGFVRPAGSVALALTLAAYLQAPSNVAARPAPPEFLGASSLGARGAQTISGRATVVDGDTLEISGERIRLEGIDAPEASQTCGRRWLGTWSCGSAATAALQKIVGTRRVDCQSAGRDKYGRMLGWCAIDGRDVNAEMVTTGNAWAFVKYSRRYEAIEAEARKAKVGIWQGDAQPAWLYREQRWQVAETAAPEGCAIKGNITSNGRIYHTPWSAWYGKVKVEPAKGERWFCSEKEAAEAGFRPVAGH